MSEAKLSLISAKIYLIFAFNSTSQSIGADQALLDADIKHVVLPLPTAISASCGLAIKAWPADQKLCSDTLTQAGLDYTIYLGTKNGKEEKYEILN